MNIIKPKQSLIALLSVLILLSSCYTLKNEKVVSKKRLPDSRMKVAGDYYRFVEKSKPSLNSPYSVLELEKSGNYRYEITEQVEQTREIDAGMAVIGGIGLTGATGALFASNMQWFQEESTKGQAFLAGAAVGGLAWYLLISLFSEEYTTIIYRKNYEYEYEKEAPLKNTEITISANKVVKKIKSDDNSLLKFSPPYDFNLETTLDSKAIDFNLKYGNKSFTEPLKLLPSDWMQQYAKILKPKTLAIELQSGEQVGMAREGTIYKVLNESENGVNILMGSKTGWINKENASVYYAMHSKNDYSAAIKNYVTDEMLKWLKQGEFELPDDYLKRIAKKDAQLTIFTNEAMGTFQKEYADYFEWDKATISRYDPNSQTFKVKIPELDEYIIKVPIENAKKFKENWNSNKFINQNFTLIDGNWQLVSFEIEEPSQNFIARYDSKITSHYDPTNQFAFDFTDFEVDVPDLTIKNNITSNQVNNEEFDAYSIKTNLPKTSMSQPDAIAVVIGNAFYQKTAAVNYAINDAQLMKLYLTRVLGFKEGNIIFTMNATKAELEGLFGTETNHKGRLFNYLKPDISDVFIFYSGHGAPDPETKEAYFIPTDCDPSYVQLQGYAVKTLYKNLAKLPAKSTTVILDACFSGAGVLKNISSVRIKPKNNEENIRNGAIISSSSGTQVSSWYNQKKHGLFSYFFLKAIHDYKNSDTNNDQLLTINEIYNYVADKTNGVPYFARRLNAVEQSPVLRGSNTERVFVNFN